MSAKRILIGAGALLMSASVAVLLAMHFLSSTALSISSAPPLPRAATPQPATPQPATPPPRARAKPRALVRPLPTVRARASSVVTATARPRVTPAPVRAGIVSVHYPSTLGSQPTLVPPATLVPLALSAPPTQIDCEVIELTDVQSKLAKRIATSKPPLPC